MKPTGSRVLIVDDDADIRINFSDILTDLGYRTTTAEDGYVALEFARKELFDVVLLDYKMPGMDGATLSREIKKLQPAIAAIMITAWPGNNLYQLACRQQDPAPIASNVSSEDGCGSDGDTVAINAILEKPVDMQKLIAMIATGGTAGDLIN